MLHFCGPFKYAANKQSPLLLKYHVSVTGKDMEGSGRVLISNVIHKFALKDEGNPRNFS
jgi:hypothetical protein